MTMNKADERMRSDVQAELAADPRLPYADEIAVEASGDVVTLRGTVGSFGQRHAALADARRTRGVVDVYDELEVRILNEDRRKDAEIRGDALQRLVEDRLLANDYVDVHVRDGWVRLSGQVDSQLQSDAAFDHMLDIDGIRGVTNEIKVVERFP